MRLSIMLRYFRMFRWNSLHMLHNHKSIDMCVFYIDSDPDGWVFIFVRSIFCALLVLINEEMLVKSENRSGFASIIQIHLANKLTIFCYSCLSANR